MNVISWDTQDNSKLSLSESQKDTIFDLTLSYKDRPIKKAETFLNTSKDIHDTAESNEQVEIQLASQFYSWLSNVEDELIEEADQEMNDYLSYLHDQQENCSAIIEEIDVGLNHLSELKSRYTDVATNTNALHAACEHLLSDQTNLLEKAKCLEEAVRYFNNLDAIYVKLSLPHLQVSVETFQPIFNQIDETLRHVQQHPEYKESALYQSRLQECLMKALNILKTYVIQSLEKSISNLTEQKESLSTENAFTVLYGKFRAQGVKIRCLMELIEERLDVNSEYQRAVSDCQSFYVSKRKQLLLPVVQNALADLLNKYPRDNCSFLRSGCALMLHLCEDESQLYNQFFTSKSETLNDLLEQVCMLLYDAFRPSIIHINHVETLAELCSILKVEMIEEQSFDSREVGVFIDLCETILADVQERLVYRTHVHCQSQILGFQPSPGDLAYPEKLEMMKSISDSLKNSSSSASSRPALLSASSDLGPSEEYMVSPGSHMSLSPADLQGMWYPTVRRTLICLSKLSRCLDSTTFQGLAQDCIAQCVQSLVNASDKICSSKSQTDAQLFLIKHLLILREQVAPFNIEFTVTETALGFNRLKDAAYNLLSAKSRLLALNRTNALLNFLLETPEVIQSVVDSKRQADGQLKATCESFINLSVEKVISRAQQFVNKVNTINVMNNKPDAPQVSLTQQPFANVENLQEMASEVQRNLSQMVPGIQKALSLYLANPDTEHILFRPIKTAILKEIRNVGIILANNYSEEDRQIISWPTEDQVNLLLQMK